MCKALSILRLGRLSEEIMLFIWSFVESWSTSLLSKLQAPAQLELMRKQKVRVNLPPQCRSKKRPSCLTNPKGECSAESWGVCRCLSIIEASVEHTKIFRAVQHSIIGRFLSAMTLPPFENMWTYLLRPWVLFCEITVYMICLVIQQLKPQSEPKPPSTLNSLKPRPPSFRKGVWFWETTPEDAPMTWQSSTIVYFC